MKLALAGLIVLVIGDSHIASTNFFNNAFHDALIAEGAAVHTYGVCGSSAEDWVAYKLLPCGRGERHNEQQAQIDNSTPVAVWSLPSLIERYHPNVLVVELGDNMAGYGVLPELPRTWIAKEVSDLTRPIAAAKLLCIWVGPPWGAEGGKWKKTYARVRELSDYLSQIVAPCRYIDSLRFARPGEWPTLDGVHLTAQGNQIWSSDVARAITEIVHASR